MLNLGTTYLIVKNMADSIAFYQALLDMPVTSQNDNRWAQFDIGNASISLLNPDFDEEKMGSGENLEKLYNQAYISYIQRTKIRYGNNVVLNFWVNDLNAEYERVKKLGIGTLSQILYINVAAPYYCFMIDDPDGNPIEITGDYSPFK
ncbi:MAG: VOC family protein [Anaerolineaceae bacterium]|nr:VOC family protein [Anaerolineaceae bacterium]